MDPANEMSGTPNYAALFRRLFTLRRMPDARPCSRLRKGSEIRGLGFAAEAGPWVVPRFPNGYWYLPRRSKLSLPHAVDRDLRLFSGFDSEPEPDCLGDGD